MYKTFTVSPTTLREGAQFDVDLSHNSNSFTVTLQAPSRVRSLAGVIIADRSFPTSEDVSTSQNFTFTLGNQIVVGSLPTLSIQFEHRTGTASGAVSVTTGSITIGFSLDRENGTVTVNNITDAGIVRDFPMLLVIQSNQ